MYKKLLLALCIGTVGLSTTQALRQEMIEGGWASPSWFDSDPHALESIPAVWEGDGKGKTFLLYQSYEQVHGVPYDPRNQGQAPSCVGQATAAACDILASQEIADGENERAPPANAAAETIYGWSRIKIGGINPNMFGGGSHVRWAAATIQQFGVVPMRNFPELGIDLSVPSASRCIEYGMQGVPVPLESIGQRHIVVEYIKVQTYEEVRDAVANGCPVIIGSNVGFGAKNGARRDKDGFLNRPTNLFGFHTSRWNHAMVILGVSDEGRAGAFILNSWGANWVSGPKRFGDEPEGGFWADAEDIDDIVRQGDSFAIRVFVGYQSYNFGF